MGSDDDRFFCSWRMSLLCELAGMTGYALNWKKQATPSGQEWWVLGRSERRTGGTGCGLWPTAKSATGDYQYSRGNHNKPVLNLSGAVKDWQTPNAMAGGNKSRGGKRIGELLLAGQVKAWPTPRAEDSEQTGAHETPDTLTSAARTWPTPRASENENRTTHHAPSHGVTHGKTLAGEVGLHAPESRSMSGKRHGCLNSRWVASLMGYPSDWCALKTETPSKPMATVSSRRSRRR